jgi:hypothetical protein
MKISLTNEYGTYTIELEQEYVQLNDYIENLIIPVLLAAGFVQESIDGYFSDHSGPIL